ncbi:MAG: DUF3098 domain-containing protein [Bacteroidales bacterium]|nr:DUF3098 domain-containing protein [Bacteroidales bacterium]MDY0215445.1 DUF3098 domain-containing protein [Bacteroidales bacterium]
MKVIKTEKKPPVASSKKNIKEEGQHTFLFTRTNYIIMIVGIVFIALGYILMIGGGSKDPNVFSEEIFNTQRLTVAPILLIIGFIIEIFAIMYRKKETEEILEN